MYPNSNGDANKQAEAGQLKKMKPSCRGSCERLSASDTISAKIGRDGRLGMGKLRALPMIQDVAAQSRQLTRREMVQRLLAGAGAAWPLVAASHPIYAHLANDAIFDEAEKLRPRIGSRFSSMRSRKERCLRLLKQSFRDPGQRRRTASSICS